MINFAFCWLLRHSIFLNIYWLFIFFQWIACLYLMLASQDYFPFSDWFIDTPMLVILTFASVCWLPLRFICFVLGYIGVFHFKNCSGIFSFSFKTSEYMKRLTYILQIMSLVFKWRRKIRLPTTTLWTNKSN